MLWMNSDGTEQWRQDLRYRLKAYFDGLHTDALLRQVEEAVASPRVSADIRLMAYGMQAELRRSWEEFENDELDYLQALSEAESTPLVELRGNEWSVHWYPRAQVGLTLVTWRSLPLDYERSFKISLTQAE